MEKNNNQLFTCRCCHVCTHPAMCTACACQCISVRCVFQRSNKIYSFDLYSLFIDTLCNSLLLLHFVDSWYPSCVFSKCSTFGLSLLVFDHIFHFSKAFGNLSFKVLLVSTSILLTADFKNTYLESLGLLWKYQIETD